MGVYGTYETGGRSVCTLTLCNHKGGNTDEERGIGI